MNWVNHHFFKKLLCPSDYSWQHVHFFHFLYFKTMNAPVLAPQTSTRGSMVVHPALSEWDVCSLAYTPPGRPAGFQSWESFISNCSQKCIPLSLLPFTWLGREQDQLHCCSWSYYWYAPASCKTSICHLSAQPSMKSFHYAMPLPASCPRPPCTDCFPPVFFSCSVFRSFNRLVWRGTHSSVSTLKAL